MNSTRKRGRRIRRMVAASAVAVGTIAATATVAAADESCTSGTGYVTCFSVTDVGNNDYAIHIGIDVEMSQQDAQTFIDHPGEEFSGTMMGEDYIWDNALFDIPVTWSAAWEGGLSAEFDVVVDGSQLNEDWEGEDEVYGRVRLWDPRTGDTRTFTTDVFSHYY
ncbi:MAG TPA: hypothetical protein VFJ97_03790 [Dermatophilaceae bacterium]|nr:hypothetical protein [Dermatophilaceae bacterium]